MISIRSLLKEDEFDLSDNPFSTKKRWTGIKRNQCIMYNPDRDNIDGSTEALRVVNGSAEEVAGRYFDQGVQEQLDKIKDNYLKDPYDFNEEDFLISSEAFDITKLDADTYSTRLIDIKDSDHIRLFFIGYNSSFFEEMRENTQMIDGVLEFMNEDHFEDSLHWRLYNRNNRSREVKTLPDDFFNEYFLELKDKLANG
jgi:hypothetical protein